MTGALFHSILQRSTPLALQGRVFAAYGQLCAVMAPLSFLVTGPLADRWLEAPLPVAKQPWLLALIGDGAGAWISFIFVVSGVLLLAGVLWTLSSRKVRQLDAEIEP